MPKTRYSEKFCKLKGITVNTIEKSLEEPAPGGALKWSIERCLKNDRKCYALNCKYTSIGDKGDIDPFD